MKRKMTSKKALKKLSGVPIFEDDDRNMITDIDCCCVYIGDLCEVYEREVNIIKKDLDRLEKLEKVIDFLKLNFNMSLDSKLRISDDSECVQTFITCLPENTTIYEMFKVLREVLEND